MNTCKYSIIRIYFSIVFVFVLAIELLQMSSHDFLIVILE